MLRMRLGLGGAVLFIPAYWQVTRCHAVVLVCCVVVYWGGEGRAV